MRAEFDVRCLDSPSKQGQVGTASGSSRRKTYPIEPRIRPIDELGPLTANLVGAVKASDRVRFYQFQIGRIGRIENLHQPFQLADVNFPLGYLLLTYSQVCAPTSQVFPKNFPKTRY